MWRLLGMCVLAAAVAGLVQSATMSESDWKRWLADVNPLLTAAEKKDAPKVAAQDREGFREAFWARRNPDGQGADNPQRAEFERRASTADKRFRAGSNGGWNDCGRAFVLLGKPDRVSNRTSATHFATDDRLKTFRDQDDVPSESWFYRNPVRLPTAPEGYSFEFTQLCESANGPAFQRLLQTVAASYLVAR